jgi:hypothetical protein
MGMITFQLPANLSAAATRDLERACLAGGPDNMPWPSNAQVEAGYLTIHRDVGESGYLVAPCEIEAAGRLMGTSATLMEREQPYHFHLELARGKVNQLRCQTADWQAGGLTIPDSLQEQIRRAQQTFGQALHESAPASISQYAQNALTASYHAAEHLVQAYMDQVFQVRHQRQPRLDTALGCRLETMPQPEWAGELVQTFNSICIAFPWSRIETSEGNYRWQQQDAILDWAETHGLRITGGPLIDFSAVQMPDWLWLWERDLSGLAKFMSNYVATTVKRYRRRIRRWHLTSAGNSATVLSLSEDELLWLTVKLAQVVRQIDAEIELIVGLAQPWGEYMAVEERTHSPFIFADTLIRSELDLGALDLEVVMGVTPRGSYCRDLLETSRMLDLYALLGVPLEITLGYPSAGTTDAKADPELRIGAGEWRDGFSPENQADWVAAFGALALCKPYVQALHWAHLADANVHQFPHCGLVDAKGKPKPAWPRLRELREKHLR